MSTQHTATEQPEKTKAMQRYYRLKSKSAGELRAMSLKHARRIIVGSMSRVKTWLSRPDIVNEARDGGVDLEEIFTQLETACTELDSAIGTFASLPQEFKPSVTHGEKVRLLISEGAVVKIKAKKMDVYADQFSADQQFTVVGPARKGFVPIQSIDGTLSMMTPVSHLKVLSSF